MSDDSHVPPATPAPLIRCTFVAFRGVDPLFARTVSIADVPRVGERVHLWFEAAANVRGVVRDVRWVVPESGDIAVNVQVELSEVDRRRFARRGPITTAIDDDDDTH